MLLVAGGGTRLRPLTDRIPKCMVPIGGKPLLQHTIEWCRGFGIVDFVINPCHLPHVIMDHFGDGSGYGVHIEYSVETTPLGTAGGVKHVADRFDRTFLVWYGDNLSRCDLNRLGQVHRDSGADVTLALHHREDPTQSGIVGLDSAGRITRFLEKPHPDQVFSHWVSAGILLCEPSVLERIPEASFADFGRDIFPRMLMEGRPLNGYPLSAAEGLWWIDRPADLVRVQDEWEV